MINENNKMQLLKLKMKVTKKSRDQYDFPIRKAYIDDQVIEYGYEYDVYIDLKSKRKV